MTTFRTIDGRPIRWRDDGGVVHLCEGADIHPGVRLIWTLCHRDVPANAAFLAEPGERFDICGKCAAAVAEEALGRAMEAMEGQG